MWSGAEPPSWLKIVLDRVGIPGGTVQRSLEAGRSAVTCVLGQLPAVLTLPRSWQAPDGVLIVDDTGFAMKGITSASLQRQYSAGHRGPLRRLPDRGLRRVSLFKGRGFGGPGALPAQVLDRETGWCRAVEFPGSRGFATKGELARVMIQRAPALPLPITWVTGDCAYGQEWRMRRTLKKAGVGYVLAAPKSPQLCAHFGLIDQAIATAPDEAW